MHRYQNVGVTILLARLTLGALAGTCGSALAQEAAPPAPSPRFWLQLEGGDALLLQRPQVFQEQARNNWTLSLAGGWKLRPEWLIGVDWGGVFLQDSRCNGYGVCTGTLEDIETKGKDLIHYYAVTEFHPHGGRWLFRGALGLVQYCFGMDLSRGACHSNLGWGGEIGVGYDWPWHRHGHVGLRAEYETGRVGGGNDVQAFGFNMVKATLSLSYY
jgi:hypothetical protein